MPRLFEVFVQGRQNLDRAEGGLGLGLTLVKKLVELQGGDVEAKSPGVGQGSTFVVRLPRLLGVVAGRTDEAPARPMAPALRVLIVEDNDDARDMLRTWLQLGGHEVYEAANGPDAVGEALRVLPNVALLDLGLPGFDGLEVARRLREDARGRGIVLVAVTGYGQTDDRRRTAEIGFDAHLVKPVTAERLDEVLSLARHAARNSSASLASG
jgi:CheY-like chemotaxis protein